MANPRMGRDGCRNSMSRSSARAEEEGGGAARFESELGFEFSLGQLDTSSLTMATLSMDQEKNGTLQEAKVGRWHFAAPKSGGNQWPQLGIPTRLGQGSNCCSCAAATAGLFCVSHYVPVWFPLVWCSVVFFCAVDQFCQT